MTKLSSMATAAAQSGTVASLETTVEAAVQAWAETDHTSTCRGAHPREHGRTRISRDIVLLF